MPGNQVPESSRHVRRSGRGRPPRLLLGRHRLTFAKHGVVIGSAEQLTLRVEVEPDRLDGDTSSGGDIRQHRPGIATLAEQLVGGLDDPQPRGIRPVAPRRWVRPVWGLDSRHIVGHRTPSNASVNASDAADMEGTCMPITVLIFLHVLTWFAVVTLHSGPQVLIVAARRSQPAAIPGIARAYARSGRLVPPLGILGGLLGLAAALVGGYDLGAPWLLIAYALFLAIIVYGARVSVPFVSALGDTVRDGRDIEADVLGSRLPRIFAIDAGIYVLVIADMVLKPLS